MKKIIFLLIIALCWLSACTPENPTMDDIANTEDMRIKVFDLADDNSFMLVNGIQGQILPPKWDLGNGQTAIGDTVVARYAFEGTYTITMSGFDGEKMVTVKKEIRITDDNMALVSDPIYNFLTGGVSAANGKTWMLDSLKTGHVRLWKRQAGQVSDDKKAPHFYDNTGMYDDRITFKLIGAECNYENHGKSYSHGGTIDGIANFRINELKQMGTVTGFTPSPKGDYIVDYTPGTHPQKWSLVKKTDTSGKEAYYLKLTGGAYMFFYRGDGPNDIEYKIDSIADNYMRVIHFERSPASRATALWEEHYILVPEGTQLQEEVPPTPEVPKADNINENFEGATISFDFTKFDSSQNGWLGLPSWSVVRNVSQTGINASDSIIRFVRGTGYDEQLKIVRNHMIDLSQKNQFEMMVYMPSTNNYAGVNLTPTIEVRLMNSKSTAILPVVVTKTETSANFNKWVKLTFDFSPYASRTDLDTWVIQFGGQYPKGISSNPGIFYFDNLILKTK